MRSILKRYRDAFNRNKGPFKTRHRREDPGDGGNGGGNGGMALLITLSIVTVLITATLSLNRKMRDTVIATAASRDRITLSQMAAAGAHAAMAMLVKDKKETRVDSMQEDWANPEKIAEVLAAIPFDQGKVSFSISDELGLIQANALVEFPAGTQFNESQKIMWDRFTRLIIDSHEAFEDLEAPTIVNSLKDWLDSNDDDAITGLTGAESDYYENLEPPYACANGPFRHIDDLARVRGIAPELFWGIESMPGLRDFLTVQGMTPAKKAESGRGFTFEGKININTAPLPVLVALIPSENPEYAQLIYDYRMEKEEDTYIHDLSSPTWYTGVPEIPGDLVIDPRLITNVSDLFRIEAKATLNDQEMTVTVIARREKIQDSGAWRCRALTWQTG